MFTRINWIAGGTIALTLLGAGYAQGAVITFTMEGTITTVNDPLGLLTFAGVDDRVVYTFSFDSESPDKNPTPTLGIYDAISANVRANETAFGLASMELPTIEVQHPLDLYDVYSWFNTGLPSLVSVGFAHFVLSDQNDNNVLTGDSLPLLPLDLGPFASRWFDLQFWPVEGGHDRPTLYLSGRIDSFTPEPTCLTSLALIALLCRRTGRTRRH